MVITRHALTFIERNEEKARLAFCGTRSIRRTILNCGQQPAWRSALNIDFTFGNGIILYSYS